MFNIKNNKCSLLIKIVITLESENINKCFIRITLVTTIQINVACSKKNI